MLSILLYGEESIAKYRSKIFTIYFYLFILLDCVMISSGRFHLSFYGGKYFLFLFFYFSLFLSLFILYFSFHHVRGGRVILNVSRNWIATREKIEKKNAALRGKNKSSVFDT